MNKRNRRKANAAKEAAGGSGASNKREEAQVAAMPPPIILAGKYSMENVKKLVQPQTDNFLIKYFTEETQLKIAKKKDRNKVINKLNEEKLQYFTYTDPKFKIKSFVVKGLDRFVCPEDIKKELAVEYDLKVSNCGPMKGAKSVLYVVSIKGPVNIQDLKKNVTYLNHTRIHWEKYENKKVLTQCHRCQKWGHATTNCRNNAKCVKCAGNHLSRKCKVPRETPATCANCSGAHPASSIKCTNYIQVKSFLERYRPKKHKTSRESSICSTDEHNPNLMAFRDNRELTDLVNALVNNIRNVNM